MFEQKKITAVEERRKQQENRKFSKALKSHKAKEKTEDKKRTLDAVKQWKKDKAHRYVHGEGLDGGRGGEREKNTSSRRAFELMYEGNCAEKWKRNFVNLKKFCKFGNKPFHSYTFFLFPQHTNQITGAGPLAPCRTTTDWTTFWPDARRVGDSEPVAAAEVAREGGVEGRTQVVVRRRIRSMGLGDRSVMLRRRIPRA